MFSVVCVCPSACSQGGTVNVTIIHGALDLAEQGTHPPGAWHLVVAVGKRVVCILLEYLLVLFQMRYVYGGMSTLPKLN